MRDVYAIFGTLLAFGIAFPGWMVAWWLLFPVKVESAETHLTQHPKRTFTRGLITLTIIGGPTLLLANLPLPFAQIAAAGIGLFLVGYAAVGAAAIVLQMSKRLQAKSNKLSPAAAFLFAAVALQLAAIIPLVGWLLFVPVCVILSLGAATYTLRLNPFRRHQPHPVTEGAPLTIDLDPT